MTLCCSILKINKGRIGIMNGKDKVGGVSGVGNVASNFSAEDVINVSLDRGGIGRVADAFCGKGIVTFVRGIFQREVGIDYPSKKSSGAALAISGMAVYFESRTLGLLSVSPVIVMMVTKVISDRFGLTAERALTFQRWALSIVPAFFAFEGLPRAIEQGLKLMNAIKGVELTFGNGILVMSALLLMAFFTAFYIFVRYHMFSFVPNFIAAQSGKAE